MDKQELWILTHEGGFLVGEYEHYVAKTLMKAYEAEGHIVYMKTACKDA